jgi:hypothetical protein
LVLAGVAESGLAEGEVVLVEELERYVLALLIHFSTVVSVTGVPRDGILPSVAS